MKALLAARKKAAEMAKTLDVKIGLPVSIVENPTTTYGRRFNNVSQNSIDFTLSDPNRQSQLEPGLISVVEQVEVTFRLQQ